MAISSGTIIQVATPVVGLAVMLLAMRLRGMPWRKTLALRRPSVVSVLVAIPVWGAWVAIGEVLSRVMIELPYPESFRLMYSPAEIVLRGIGMIVLAPAFEEALFRGLIYDRVRASRLGSSGAVVVSAVLFACMHLQYGPIEMALIVGDGIVLGLVRRASGSVPLTALLHSLANGYALAQRLR